MEIRVLYPFHALRGQELEVIREARCKDGEVTVKDPRGHGLKIPVWMLSRAAATFSLSATPVISTAALLSLTGLLAREIEGEPPGDNREPAAKAAAAAPARSEPGRGPGGEP